MKNPIKLYLNYLRKSIEPKDATHDVSMNIEIPKGKTEGRALVPCATYTLSHSIDLNPALIRKRDQKFIKKLPVKKRIEFDSNKYDVVLTKEEKDLGYELTELKKCEHCGQKIVIAEVAETRYRSCPDIKVRIADKAKENLVIPVKFGIRKQDVSRTFYTILFLDFVFLYMVLSLIFPKINFLSNLTSKLVGFNHIIGYIGIGIISLIFLHFMIATHYRGYRLFKWYSKIKPTLTKKCQNK